MITKLLVLVALTVALLASASAAHTATVRPALHVGSTGTRVRNLQWLLHGNPPSNFSSIKTYRGPVDGRYGRNTAQAVYAMKFRLGYPKASLSYTASDKLVRILLGKEKRPITWIATAVRRQAGIAKARAKLTSCQTRVVHWAESQVGIVEYPWGSNRGPGISYATSRTSPSYQSITGAYGAAWCASFAQWVLYKSGAGPIADRSAGVFYIRSWAANRGLLRATPVRGDLVLFLNSQGHMGIVTGVSRYGFTTVEGNTSNGVYARSYSFSSYAKVFVRLPNCTNVLPTPPITGDKILGFAWWQIVGSILAALASALAGHWHLRRRAARKIAQVEAEIAKRL